MKIIPNYNNDAFIIPTEALNYISEASKTDIIILLYMLSKKDFSLSKACEELKIEENEFVDSINYWASKGIISGKRNISNSNINKREIKVNTSEEKRENSPTIKQSLPNINSPEAAKLLESNKMIAKTIHECESIFGKSFTSAENNTVINLYHYLNLSPEYICLLFQYAKTIDKANVRYIERTAIELVDKGIDTYDTLEEEISKREKLQESDAFIRNTFGLGKRAITQKEREKLTEWYINWKFTDDIVLKAFEISADSINNPTLNYVNTILEDWHNNKLNNVDEINQYLQKRKSGRKANAKPKKGTLETKTFDTDDFFEAALNRSYSKKQNTDK